MATGIATVDSVIAGLPRGAITEIFGAPSSGRTSFMLSLLAHAAAHKEVCALIDTSDVFDPNSASELQLDLDQLLWIRCAQTSNTHSKPLDLLDRVGFWTGAVESGRCSRQGCATHYLFLVVSLSAYC